MRDWPDPRFSDKPISPIAVVLAGLLVGYGYFSMIWGAIDMVRRVIS